MSNELFVTYPGANTPYVVLIRPSDGYVWNPATKVFVLEADLLTNIDTYDIPMPNLVGHEYAVDMPNIPFGTEFKAQYFEQAGGFPASSDLVLDNRTGTWIG